MFNKVKQNSIRFNVVKEGEGKKGRRRFQKVQIGLRRLQMILEG